ncbi:hypothetical protein BDN67DRAFT_1018085 [Paxillus ammoniavirescens]|nr:hypothetical protein BDN67DRAFT_1018085 [Paxillus ammoniavirescens]
MNVNANGQYTSNEAGDLPPEPLPFLHHPAPPPLSPPPAPPSPSHPKRHHTIDTTKSNTTAAQRHADAMHDPGGQMDPPGSQPLTIRLEGERIRVTSLHVETADNDHAEEDPDNQNPPRNPVGMTDGDEHHPNGPTEPPDEKEGERGVDGKLKVKTVKNVESRESSRVDEPEDEGVERETRLKEIEDELGGTVEDNRGHRDGRTNDMGDQMSSASYDSQRVETGALAEDKVSQH